MGKLAVLLALAMLVTFTGCSDDDDSPTAPPAPFPAFTDTFDDGVIDAEMWEAGGKIAEAGGVLQLRRDGTGDFIQTVDTYSGDWVLELEIRLNEIHWHDMFHGLSIRDEEGDGLSFGFSQYGKLFISEHTGTSTGTGYGPDNSNRVGVWQVWTLTRANGEVTILVDGSPVAGIEPKPVPENVRIILPGRYSDGDGAGGTNITSSDVTEFSIAEAP